MIVRSALKGRWGFCRVHQDLTCIDAGWTTETLVQDLLFWSCRCSLTVESAFSEKEEDPNRLQVRWLFRVFDFGGFFRLGFILFVLNGKSVGS